MEKTLKQQQQVITKLYNSLTLLKGEWYCKGAITEDERKSINAAGTTLTALAIIGEKTILNASKSAELLTRLVTIYSDSERSDEFCMHADKLVKEVMSHLEAMKK